MDKKVVMGYFAVIISALVLSIELYALKFIQYVDMKINGSCYTHAIDYIYESPMSLALLITIVTIILGGVLILQGKKECN